MIRAVALVDLDDTLFQTRGKCPPDVPAARLTALGFAQDGAPLSFATPRQLGFVRWLAETTHVVPVTGRSRDALRRADVPHRAAICAHGGVILGEDGHADPDWHEQMSAAAEPHRDALHACAAAVGAAAERLGQPVSARVLSEGGVPLYAVAKHASGDAALLAEVVDASGYALPAGWTEHRNGNNIARLPPHLGKKKAVAHLLPGIRARFPDLPVIGIGDSRSDAAFMRLCDFAMLPTASQLGWRLFDAV